MTYQSRSLDKVVKRAAREFPVVVVTGPRQSGKTTFLRTLFGERYRDISLEPPDVQAAASNDPRAFLAANGPPIILDEVQYVPELLPYIKEKVDERRDVRGQYLLTGWQNLLLMERVTESLAGRAAMLQLLPFSWRETSAGREVDFLVEKGDRLVPIEVKLSATPRPAMAAAIETLRSDLGARVTKGYVVHPGDIELPLTGGVEALPFSRLWDK